ncbi:MAG TPA: hypothetical protein PKH24_09475 [Sedimentisphaerales bacterium]|jgi:hypothetical protein|nr:hypothetical protein [Sedimentisphaerales bacterium]HNU29386.1 hypothetical protein [Sedimentisphaerales bacterium]
MSERREAEITMISDHPTRRPYAARVGVVLEEGIEYHFDGEACLLTEGNFIVRFKPEKEKCPQDNSRLQRLSATIEGFATASEAERMGLKLSLALLWLAVSTKHHLRLEYHTPQPCVVFDRTQKSASGFSFSARLTLSSDPARLRIPLDEVLGRNREVDPCVLISMELFASSMLELTERARFITLVSCLEPLASQESYANDRLENAISQFACQLATLSLPEVMQESVVSRARALCRESISQSIIRLVQTHIPGNPKVVQCVREAYQIRSRILHEGTFDADLQEKGRQLADIIRYIYSRILQTDLQIKASINA